MVPQVLLVPQQVHLVLQELQVLQVRMVPLVLPEHLQVLQVHLKPQELMAQMALQGLPELQLALLVHQELQV
jgi:hypothetical protein